MMKHYFLTEMRLTLRKRVNLMLAILLPLIFYIIFTSILDLPKDVEKAFNKEYMYSMTAFSLSNFCLMQFPMEMITEKVTGWYKNIIRTPLQPYQYYGAKILKIMIQFAISIVVIFTVAHFYKNVNMSLAEWISSGVILWIGASTFLGIGVLIAQLNDVQKASGIGSILYLGLAVIGGLWYPTTQFPEWLKQISHATPTYNLKKVAFDIGKGDPFSYHAFFILIGYSILFLIIALLIIKRREVEV